jgi:hypothetical protein
MEINAEMKNSKNLVGETINVWTPDATLIGDYNNELASSLVDNGCAYLITTMDVVFY